MAHLKKVIKAHLKYGPFKKVIVAHLKYAHLEGYYGSFEVWLI